MEQKKKWDLAALASIPLAMTLGNSMLIPVLPTIEKKINITPFQSSMIISVYSIVSIFLIPLAGFLSDRIGRKKVIIPSLIITGAGGIISGLAAWLMKNPYWLILTGRLIQGIGSSGAFPVVIPTVGDMYKNESDVSKGLGIIETSNTFGKVISPILGALLAAWVWFIPFLFIPFFAAISVLLVAFLVKVPKQSNQARKKSFKELSSAIKNILKQKTWLYAAFVIGFASMFVYFGILFYFTSALEDKFGINGIKKGLVIAIPLLFLCITSYITGRTIGKKKRLMKWVILSGYLITGGALLWLSFSNSLIMLVIILSVAGLGIGAVLPSLDALITEGIEKEERGTITSLYSSMRLFGVAVGPPVAAVLMRGNYKTLLFVLSGFSAATAIVTLMALKPPEGGKKEQKAG